MAESFAKKEIEIDLNQVLGSGGFGTVYKGQWLGLNVAVKKLHLTELGNESLKDFKREIKIMKCMRFDYVVTYYGACLEPGNYSMVMEYMPNRSLNGILSGQQELTWNTRWTIASYIAKGLRYLHRQKILHRDLKSHNVLLNDRMEAKLSDFGLSRIKEETCASTSKFNTPQAVGTVRWMAPELFDIEPI